MAKIASLLTMLATVLLCLLPAAPALALAQRARTFVASYGSDSNPCTFGSPCKTFQAAYNAVAAGGEVTAIDSAGFGPLTIAKSVTITSPNGVEAGIVPDAGSDAIDISASSDITVTLRGLTLQGGNTGAHGIFLTSTLSGTGSALNIFDCYVANFVDSGIAIQPMGSTGTGILASIANTASMSNGGSGIKINPNGAVNVTAYLQNTITSENGYGINLSNLAAAANIVGVRLFNAQSVGNTTFDIVTTGTELQSQLGLDLYISLWQSNIGKISLDLAHVDIMNRSFVGSIITPEGLGAASDGTNYFDPGSNTIDLVPVH